MSSTRKRRQHRRWPLYLIGSSAAVAVWSGWVGLGEKTGFGPVHLLPGIWNSFVINTAITLPIGVEAYGAYALGAWIDRQTPKTARKFAKRSAIGSLVLGALGQIAYHLLAAYHQTSAPWEIVTAVSVLPVVTLGFAAALHHLRGQEDEPDPEPDGPVAGPPVETLERVQASLPAEVRQRPFPPVPMPEAPAPWEDESGWTRPVTPPAEPRQPDDTFHGQISVRNPLSRLDRKVQVDERLAARTGQIPAIRD